MCTKSFIKSNFGPDSNQFENKFIFSILIKLKWILINQSLEKNPFKFLNFWYICEVRKKKGLLKCYTGRAPLSHCILPLHPHPNSMSRVAAWTPTPKHQSPHGESLYLHCRCLKLNEHGRMNLTVKTCVISLVYSRLSLNITGGCLIPNILVRIWSVECTINCHI